jgi:hypothetical protein
MSNKRERLAVAQWVLERNLAWIAAAEVKVGVVVAIDIAMLGGLAAAFTTSDQAGRTAWAYLCTLSAAGTAAIAVICAAISVMPRVSGPARSLIFFGRVVETNSATYSDKFRKATDTELLDDLTTQIHRNAEIAASKFGWVRKSMGWSFFSVIPWIVAIAMLTKR